MDATARERDPGARDPGAGLGFALLLAWIGLVVSGFQVLIAAPMRAALDAGAAARLARPFEEWVAALDSGPLAQPTLYIDPAACACRGGAFEALGRRAARDGIAVRRAGPALPGHAEVAAFDAGGRLRYAGPLHPAVFCLGERSPAELLLRTDAPVALVLPAECPCGRMAPR